MTTEETLHLAKAYALAAYMSGVAFERYRVTRLPADLQAAEQSGEAVEAARIALESALGALP